jgi:mRNA interferase MazF
MTMKITKIYEKYDVVIVPFPFTDTIDQKRRPAVVLSSHSKFNGQIGHCVMAMITSASHKPLPLDVSINDLDSAGITKASIIRMKLFTIDQRLILEQNGSLSKKDQRQLDKSLEELLG